MIEESIWRLKKVNYKNVKGDSLNYIIETSGMQIKIKSPGGLPWWHSG